MKKQTKKKKEPINLKKNIGSRFTEFRHLIGLNQAQLANELFVNQGTINHIEKGKSFPNIKYIVKLYLHYNLNPTWLICGKGGKYMGEKEVVKKPRKVKKSWMKSRLPCHIDSNSTKYERYLELMELMRVPAIEKVIMGKLTELELMAKEEIESFKKNHGKKKNKKNAA